MAQQEFSTLKFSCQPKITLKGADNDENGGCEWQGRWTILTWKWFYRTGSCADNSVTGVFAQ